MDSQSNSSFWDSVYLSGNTPWRGRAISPFIKDLPKGKAIDLGCGTGEKTQELIDLGFDVVGLDHSVEALKHCKSGRFEVYDLEKLKDYNLDHYSIAIDFKVYKFIEKKHDYMKTIAMHADYLLLDLMLKHPTLQVPERDIELVMLFFSVVNEWHRVPSPQIEGVTYLLKSKFSGEKYERQNR